MSFKFFNPISPQQSVATPPIVAQMAPPTSGPQILNLDLGTIWVDSATNVVYVLTSISGGVANWVNTVPASGGTFTNLTVAPGPTAITGEFRVVGNVNEANVISLTENGGPSGTIGIISEQGTGANSINIHSLSGSINIETDAVEGDIAIDSAGGSITLHASENEVLNLNLLSDGGTTASMNIINSTGTADSSLIGDAAVYIAATAGGLGVSAGKGLNLQGTSSTLVDVTFGLLDLRSTDGDILIEADSVSSPSNGTINIEANANTGSDLIISATAPATGGNPGGGLQILAGLSGMLLSSTEEATNAIELHATGSAGGISLLSGTGGIIFDTTGAFDITASGGLDLAITGALDFDATLASHFTVTGAAQDLLLSSVGGSVNVAASEAVADAITINASAGGIELTSVGNTTITSSAGNVVITGSGLSELDATGSGSSVLIAQSTNVTTIGVGANTPAASRITTINGGGVTAITDHVSIADGAVSASASAEKEVTIATGTNAVGTVLVNIASGALSAAATTNLNLATGAAPAGTTSTINVGTGTGGGTKTLNLGNTDSLTTINEFGVVNINTGTASGATSIGNGTAGGAVAIASLTTVGIDAKTASHFTVTGAAADLNLLATGGSINMIATEAIADAVVVQATNGSVAVNAPAGAITLTAGAAATLGNVSVVPNIVAAPAGPSATAIVTNSTRVGTVTFAGYTQAASSTLTITLTNVFITAASSMFASMTDVSTNATLMTLSSIKPAAGSAVLVFTNNGSQAVNGNLQLNFWVLN